VTQTRFAYARDRLRGIARPPVTITAPPAGVIVERDVPVPMPDGVVLRVNVFRPAEGGPSPVVMCAHPYGKDNLPTPFLGGYLPSVQYRVLRQPEPVRFSEWTGWEAPDPAFWVPRGYAVVNADLRGFHQSEGRGNLLTEAEGLDYHAIIEWAAAQPWSTGKVGLNGVSYLAISQWRTASTRPPHLAAICPWEGFTDMYRDIACPGGIREQGFFHLWGRGVRTNGRYDVDLIAEQAARPLRDDFWDSLAPDLSRIEVPALICGSFSDHNLHSGGAFEAFRAIGSRHKWLYTHGGGKWATYYSDEALAFQARFFDCFLKGEDNGMREVPPVRLEVRASGSEIHTVRGERAWPLPGTRWTALYLHDDATLRESRAAAPSRRSFDMRRGLASFVWTAPSDVEIAGPMKLRLHVSVAWADDACLFVGLRKLDEQGEEVFFEGSYGFGRDMLSHGFLKVSHRGLDAARSEPFRPVHHHRRAERLVPGQIVPVEIPLLPGATFLQRGESLRLDVQGRWFHATSPVTGGAAGYETSPGGMAELHVGGEYDAHLLLPFQAG
jgi:predicted acyl esterase